MPEASWWWYRTADGAWRCCWEPVRLQVWWGRGAWRRGECEGAWGGRTFVNRLCYLQGIRYLRKH
ncbi:hypothetical protein E2C01_044793 [Portunus trituberculatus]|uniref:Uncharacterized protein n=1 Tax=Portunus trituberculatus TaxID=210409 RepID=A0A5B7G1F5_PORTR|nr:hypothetical protein [Portunus trituberculatus]